MAKAKVKSKRPAPRRVWVVVQRGNDAAVDVFDVRASAVRYNRHYSSEVCKSSVREFIEVQPKRKARGK